MNFFTEKPEIVEDLLAKLTKDVQRGRSTNGLKSKNDVNNIVLWKSEGSNKGSSKPKKKKKE